MKRSRWSSFCIYLYYACRRLDLFLFPDEIERYLVDGWFYGQVGLVDRSIEAIKKALKVQPNSFIVHWCLSCAYFQKGQHAEGLLECRKALQISPPEYTGFSGYLTRAYMDREAQNSALELIQEVIRLDPQFGGTYEHLGYIYACREEWDKTSEMLEKAIALGVKSPYAYWSLGRAYEMKNCWSEALQKYREAIHCASNRNFIKEIDNRIRKLEKRKGEVKGIAPFFS